MKLLYLEDDIELGRLVRNAIERAGFVVDLAKTLRAAQAAIREAAYDLLILDRALPDGDGLDMMRVARTAGLAVPVILATAKDRVAARVEALNAGADDYVVKPFATPELLARVHALLRRPSVLAPRAFRAGNVEFAVLDRSVAVGGVSAVIARREGMLLEQLLRRAGQVVARATLENSLFGFDDDASGNAVEASVSRLRKWLTVVGADRQIHTVRGIGYILAA